MRFDGPTFAHAFLAVFAAASTDKKSPYHKSIALEVHLHGIQLVANDGRIMLTAYVPDLEHHYDGPPAAETAPERTIVLNDDDGRGRGLLGYVCQLGTRHRYGFEDYAPGTVELRVDHDQKLPPGAATQETFEGMESVYSSLHVPDRERVFLELVPISVPDWRGILDRQTAKAGARRVVGLDPETLERLGKVRKHAFGALQMTLGKTPKSLIRVEYLDSDPYVFGSIVPLEEADPDVYQDPDQTTIEDEISEALADVSGHVATGPDGTPETRREHGERLRAELEGAFAESDQKRAEVTAQIDDLAAKRQTDKIAETGRANLDDDGRLAAAAIELIASTQFGSARMLARKLAIPYARAVRLMDTLEEHGVVGPTQGTKARDVLIRAENVSDAIASVTGA